MKKILSYFLVILVILFSIPIIFTKSFTSKETVSKIEENKSETNSEDNKIENYDYGQYNTIKLYHYKTGEVEELGLDEYVKGVISAEMPASYEQEALNAQALVARTYTIFKIKTKGGEHPNGADICDNYACCQAWISKNDRLEKWKEEDRESYWNKIETAVNSTKGKIVTYNDEPINAFFHSNSGGTTENPSDVWGGTGYAYLQSVETAGEVNYDQYSSEATFTKEEFTSKMKEKHSDFNINWDEQECIKIEEYTTGGRVKTIKIGNQTLSGVEVRTIYGIRSAKFTIEIDGDNVKFSVTGYGHGVGMSQTGADSMAKEGASCEDIIKHYYTNVEIKNL